MAETRALVLANFRPEYRAAWMQRTHYQQVGLRTLAAERTAELVRVLLGDAPSLGALAERLHDATRGNPFFVEQVVHGLVDRAVLAGAPGGYRLTDPDAAIAIPATVQSVLAARIDRLPAREKEVLQAAAVAGRRFPARLVLRVRGGGEAEFAAALDALCAAELLQREQVHPEPEYAFRHPLTHEVAYETQLRARRRQRHAALAWTLAQDPTATTEEGASLVSHHLEQAGQLLEAARWRWRAIAAIGWSDATALVPHLRHTMRLTDALPADARAARLGMWARIRCLADAILSNRSAEEAERLFRGAADLAERGGHLPALATAYGWYANFLAFHGPRERARELAEEARRLAAESHSPRARIQVAYGVLNVLINYGRYRDALAFSEEVIEAASGELREADAVVLTHAMMIRCFLLQHMGRPREALEQCEKTLADRAVHHPQVAVGVAGCRAGAAFFLGETEMALDARREAVELADAWKNRGARGYTRRGLAETLVDLGQPAEALAVLDEIVELDPFRGQPDMGWLGMTELVRGRALVALGRIEEGLPLAETAWEQLQRGENVEARASAHWRMLHILLRIDPRGARARIEELLEGLDALVGDSGATSWLPYVRLARAELADALGHRAMARLEREAAVKELRAMDAVRVAGRVDAELARAATCES